MTKLLAPQLQSRKVSSDGDHEASNAFRSMDEVLRTSLEAVSSHDADFWTFCKGASRRRAHNLLQYPAMMVPPMQEVLLQILTNIDPNIHRVLDPFVGSGTTLVECMRRGLNFVGQDINPLAVLLAQVKIGPFHIEALCDARHAALGRVISDRSEHLEANFPGLTKWFTSRATVELSRLRRSIRQEPNLWCRRVLWVALAETIRRISNSRTSTYKLHIRTTEDLATRDISALGVFSDVSDTFARRLGEEAEDLRARGYLGRNCQYTGSARVLLKDARKTPGRHGSFDLLITSPPYGDNTSTVPYGQYSYLPLQWIDLEDIDRDAEDLLLKSTYEVDARSLGGSKKDALKRVQPILELSPTLDFTLRRLSSLPVDRAGRVASFYSDFSLALTSILSRLRSGAYMAWTIGNRRVGGISIPMDKILAELMQSQGVSPITELGRRIPTKRMATKNSIASTMREERILILRKD